MTDPRTIAFSVLRAVDERDAYVNLLLPTLQHELDRRDSALATELTHGTIRMRGAYDAIIDSLATRELDPAVRDALRLGAHQLLSMRVPAHAAVSTTVDLVRAEIGHKPAGFVNAILRRVATKDLDTWLGELTAGRPADEALAIRYSHPAWIVRALGEAVGPDQLEDLLAANNEPPKVTLVALPGLISPEALPGKPGAFSRFARVLPGGSPASIRAVADGRAAVQDEGSQVVALTLAMAPMSGPDERWLDLCAGPGGKTALLGAIGIRRGVRVIANEPRPHRADLVRLNAWRLPNVEVTEFDGRKAPWDDGSFDRILVDAPCTGLGALRRRPESRWRRSEADLADLVPLQTALLTRALQLVRPGGLVAYSTCSPHLAETRGVLDGVEAEVVSTRQMWPHVEGTDAMFVALLRRPARP
jgi:16S rRNA (cytosine967-C5)-methyltransferase